MVEFMGPIRRGLSKAAKVTRLENAGTWLGKKGDALSEWIERKPITPGPLLADSRIMRNASPEKLAETQALYTEVAGLGPESDFSSKAFTEHVEKRAQDFTVFSSLKDELNRPAGALENFFNLLKKKIADALNPDVKLGDPSPDDSFHLAQQKYETDIEAFEALKKKIPSELPAQATIHLLKTGVQDAKKAIMTQQKKEIDHIKQLFSDPEFTAALKNAKNLNETDPSLTSEQRQAREGISLDKIKATMLNELGASHKTQLEAFNKSTAERENKIHQAGFAALDEAAFIANQEKYGSAIVKENIKKLRKQHLDNIAANADVLVKQNEDEGPNLSTDGITLKALGDIKLNTGVTLQRGRDGTYSLTIPGSILGLTFHHGFSKKLEATLLQNAQLAMLSGKPEIKHVLSGFEDPEYAKVIAQKAFEADITAGFDPNKVVFEINGQVYRKNPNKEKGEKGFTDEKAPFANWRNYSNVVARSAGIIQKRTAAQEKLTSGQADAKQVEALKQKLASQKDEIVAVKEAEAKAGAGNRPGPQ